MVQPFLAGSGAADFVRFPPRRELGGALSKAVQKFEELRIAGPKVVRRAKLGDHAFGLIGPACSEQAPCARVGQHVDQDIAILFG